MSAKPGDDRPRALQMTMIQANLSDYFTPKTPGGGAHPGLPSHRRVALAARQFFSIGGDRCSALAEAGGSPFQSPTRLADGLGLESGLEFRCRNFCARPGSLRELVPPHPASGRNPDLGCNGQSKTNHRRIVNLRANVESCHSQAIQAGIARGAVPVAGRSVRRLNRMPRTSSRHFLWRHRS
jgi:hypothetical protein